MTAPTAPACAVGCAFPVVPHEPPALLKTIRLDKLFLWPNEPVPAVAPPVYGRRWRSAGLSCELAAVAAVRPSPPPA